MTKRNIVFLVIGILALIVGSVFAFFENITRAFIHSISGSVDGTFWGIGLQHAATESILLGLVLIAFALFYDRSPKQVISGTISALIISFIGFAWQNMINIPFHDDYFLLEFLANYARNLDLHAIFDQSNESRLIFVRTLAVGLYHLHLFNFKLLIVIALLCLLGSAFILLRSSKTTNTNRLLLILVLTIIIFQFQYYDAVVWASGALTSSCTLFFTMLSIVTTWSDLKFRFPLTLMLCLLCVASSGAGFIPFVICTGIMFFRKETLQFRVSGMILLTSLFFYFSHYSLLNDHYDSIGTEAESLFHKTLSCLVFSPIFLGSSVQFLYQVYAPFVLGLAVWGTFLVATYRKYYIQNPVIYSILLCILLFSFGPPALRNNLPAIEGINVRYGIYSIFAICCSIIMWTEMLETEQTRKCIVILIPVGIAFHLLTGIFFYPEVVLRVNEAKAMARNFKTTNSTDLSPAYKQGPTNAAYLFNACREKGIYTLPEE